MIILLVPIVGALTQKFAAYRMVVIGGAICAAGVFIMALPTEWFEPAANGVMGQWLGYGYLGLHGSIHPYYIMTALYLIVFSVGEAFYSPRVYEYAAAIAPKGQEASYGSLAYLPFLVGKLLVGTGGFLLAAFCPEHGPRHSGTMWLIFALAASVAPAGLILFRRYIRVPKPTAGVMLQPRTDARMVESARCADVTWQRRASAVLSGKGRAGCLHSAYALRTATLQRSWLRLPRRSGAKAGHSFVIRNLVFVIL
jgi:MFS family permease